MAASLAADTRVRIYKAFLGNRFDLLDTVTQEQASAIFVSKQLYSHLHGHPGLADTMIGISGSAQDWLMKLSRAAGVCNQ